MRIQATFVFGLGLKKINKNIKLIKEFVSVISIITGQERC